MNDETSMCMRITVNNIHSLNPKLCTIHKELTLNSVPVTSFYWANC